MAPCPDLASCCVLAASGWLLAAGSVCAQPTNGLVTLLQDTLAVVGAEAGRDTPVQLICSAGSPGGGETRNGVLTLLAGFPTDSPIWPPGTRTIVVTGTVDDPTAAVLVNGIPATVSVGAFSASVLLTEGPNTIRAVFMDPAGHSAHHTITVTLTTQPPPKPTVGTPPVVTMADSVLLSGTKTPGTSIWINGVDVVPWNEATTWSATVTLVEGDNTLRIVAKNAVGNVSTAVTAHIVVDALPPVIAVSPPAKTNLNPCTVTGTVDDSLTRVEVNGLLATRAGQQFAVAVPLVAGPNTVTITATSPNGWVATTTVPITLGTIPTITAIQPADGTTVYAGVSTTITATATDTEGDPCHYQVWVDGAMLVDWTPNASTPWTPPEDARGIHTLAVRVHDGFGGETSESVALYVVRRPIPPPAP